MENKNIYIIMSILILVMFCLNVIKEKFYTENTGVFNYFHEIYVNPYSQPLTKFYSNDKIQTI